MRPIDDAVRKAIKVKTRLGEEVFVFINSIRPLSQKYGFGFACVLREKELSEKFLHHLSFGGYFETAMEKPIGSDLWEWCLNRMKVMGTFNDWSQVFSFHFGFIEKREIFQSLAIERMRMLGSIEEWSALYYIERDNPCIQDMAILEISSKIACSGAEKTESLVRSR